MGTNAAKTTVLCTAGLVIFVGIAAIVAWRQNQGLPKTEVLIPSVGSFHQDGLRIAALGDSYTAGHGVAEFERWPIQLALRLQRRGTKVAEPNIIAASGWKTTNLSTNIRAGLRNEPFKPYDLVCLMIGVNDQYQGATLSDFRLNFKMVLDDAMHLAAEDVGKVVVFEIPDWSSTPFVEVKDKLPILEKLKEFNNAIREVCSERGIEVVPMLPISSEVALNPGRLLVQDQLHPSSLTYAHWADYFVPIVSTRLDNR